MSLGGGDVTTTSKTELSPQQKELLNLGMPYAKGFASRPIKYFPGNTIAPVNANEKAGLGEAVAASGRQDKIAEGAQHGFNFLTSGDLMDVGKNPYFAPAASAAARPITQALTEQELPALRDSATSSGNFGSSRQGIAEGLATGRANQAIGDITSKMAMDAYGQGLSAYENGMQMAPTIQGMQPQGALTRSAVGDVQRQLQQQKIDARVNRFNFGQMAPFMQASDILSLIAGTPGATNVSTGPGPQTNPISGALGGLTLGSALTPFVGPMGPLIGAGLGGLGSFL